MKKKSSRIVALVLTLCMVFFGLPVTAMAEGVSDENALRQAVAAGGTVTLAGDITVTGYNTLSIAKDVSVVLDLGGHTLTLNNSGYVMDSVYKKNGSTTAGLLNAGTLTIKNGTIRGSDASVALIVNRSLTDSVGTLVLAEDVDLVKTSGNAIDNLGGTITSSADITVSGSNSSAIVTYGGNVNIKSGTLNADYGMDIFNRLYNNTSAGAEVIIDGGSISAKTYALSTNNLYSGGNTPSNVTVNGGTLASSNATAIYWPTSGTLTIGKENASAQDVSITASSGSAIEICSGTLVVNGGTLSGSDSSDALNSSATWASRYRETQNGCAGLGDAVTIIARRGNPYATAPLSVTINNGVFSSSDNYAVRYFDCNQVENAAVVSQNVEVNIKGGSFTGSTAGAVDAALVAANEQKFITGGTFSTNVIDYVSSGYECKSSGNKWVVGLPDDTMIVTPETSEDGSASATLDGVYVGDNTSIATGGTDEGDTSASGNVTDTGSVEINLSTDTAATTSATLTVTDVAAASLSDAPSLTVKTKAGDVTLPKDALQKVAEAGKGGNNVTITVTKDSISGSNIKAAYTVTVEADGKNLLPASASNNGNITITVTKPEGEGHLEAWYAVKNSSGDWLPVEKLNSEETTGGKLAITITHLSTVILYNTSQSSSTVEATVTTSDNQTTSYTSLQAAIGAAGNGATVTLWQNLVLDGTGKGNTHGLLTISGKNITIDGNGKTIRSQNVNVDPNTEAGPSMINVVNGADVTFRNLTINGKATDKSGNTKHGLNIYQASVTVEENVIIKNNRWYAIVANGSNLTVNGLTTEDNKWGINVESKSGQASITVKDADIAEEDSIVFENSSEGTTTDPTGTIEGGDFQYIIFKDNADKTNLTISGGKFATNVDSVSGAVNIPDYLTSDVKWNPTTGKVEKKTTSSDDTPSLGYRLPFIGETTGGKNFVSDTTSNLTVNGKYQFRITSTDGHKPVMTVSNSNFTVELASQSGNDYFYVIRCAGAAGSTANVLVDGYQVVVATVGTAGVVSDTTHPFTVAQGATYQFKLTSASRPTFTGNNANFTIAYVSNSGNDWFFKVTAVGAAGASTTFSANGVAVTTATIA